jgi:hypothetical protein
VSSGEKNSGPKNVSKPLGASDFRPNTQIANVVELTDSVDIVRVLFKAAEIVFDTMRTDDGYEGTPGLV